MEYLDSWDNKVDNFEKCKEMIIFLLDNGAPGTCYCGLGYVDKNIQDIFKNHPLVIKDRIRINSKNRRDARRGRQPGGLISLVALGASDIALMGDPVITFKHVINKQKNERHSNQKKRGYKFKKR